MKGSFGKPVIAGTLFLAGALALASGTAGATGTAHIVQKDGATKTYSNVRIAVRDQSMWITSSDGRGTLVFGKAACTTVGELLECLPYDATLYENGAQRHVPLKSGTVWLNPSRTYQHFTNSSSQLPPRGVQLVVVTKAGTYVTLTGVVDEVER